MDMLVDTDKYKSSGWRMEFCAYIIVFSLSSRDDNLSVPLDDAGIKIPFFSTIPHSHEKCIFLFGEVVFAS